MKNKLSTFPAVLCCPRWRVGYGIDFPGYPNVTESDAKVLVNGPSELITHTRILGYDILAYIPGQSMV